MVLRYVLQNPVRSGLAASVNDWSVVKLVSERVGRSLSSGSRGKLDNEGRRTIIGAPTSFDPWVSESSKAFWIRVGALGVNTVNLGSLRLERHLTFIYVLSMNACPTVGKSILPASGKILVS
jgi:hypothetical protein